MTDDAQGRPGPAADGQLTLTEAAARCGYTRAALRARIRRKSLSAVKGNDGQYRLQARDVDDLPPPDDGQHDDVAMDAAMDILSSTVAGLRAALDIATAGRLADHGRAERAEAQAVAEASRAAVAEARLAAAEAALVEARQPWIVRVIRAVRPGG